MIIRPLQPADLSGVLRIEQAAMPDPWDATQVTDELEALNAVGFVAEEGGRLCGYAFFRTCLPESELLRLVVDPAWQHRGVGTELLTHALCGLDAQGYATCYLEVRASNQTARRLYEHAGFFPVGVRKKYYRQPVEDALQLCMNLVEIKGEHH